MATHNATHRRLLRPATALPTLALLLAALGIASLSIGAAPVGPGQVIAILAEPLTSAFKLSLPWPYDLQDALIVEQIRLPRTLLGALVGAALAVAGAALQGLFRNPLADPALIGVSAGSALAAVAVIVLGNTLLRGWLDWLGPWALPLAAFGGGLLATALIYRIARFGGRTLVATMLLAGIAVNAIAGAGTGLLTYIADDAELRTLTFWKMGSVASATWRDVLTCTPFIALAIVALPRYARALNALLLGEAVGGHLGFDLTHTKRAVIGLAALAVGAAVAVSGMIGFVGLVAPHLLRLAIGPDHRALLPGSALLGACLLLAADLLARTLIAPAELPIGLLMALLGGPFFLWLLLNNRNRPAG